MKKIARVKVAETVAAARPGKTYTHRTRIGEGVKSAADRRQLEARRDQFAEYWALGSALNIIDAFESQGNTAAEFGADVPAMKARLRALDPKVQLDFAVEVLERDTKQAPGSIRGKTGPKEPQAPTTGALTDVANHLADAARAANGVGLIDEAAELTASARDVRLLTTGSSPRTIADILKACTPIVAALRKAGQTTSADNLAKTLDELAAVGGKSGKGITTKSSAAVPVEESALPQFDARFAVEREPAPTSNDPEDTFHVEQGQGDDDGPVLRGLRITEDGR
jgi:hypothetical protein